MPSQPSNTPGIGARGSNEGNEPYLLEEQFQGKTDWRALEASFIDQAPDGYGSALSFFSDEAFHFYLPAYLIADVDGKLRQHDPAFHLTHGLDDVTRNAKINPGRYGERTWFEAKRYKFAMFSHAEAAAISWLISSGVTRQMKSIGAKSSRP